MKEEWYPNDGSTEPEGSLAPYGALLLSLPPILCILHALVQMGTFQYHLVHGETSLAFLRRGDARGGDPRPGITAQPTTTVHCCGA